jgi:hypothetical protein
MEQWRQINGFPDYLVSDEGRIQAEKSGRILAQSENQFGVVYVGMMKRGVQYHRSVALLVADHFITPSEYPAFNTPINLDGDRHNNAAHNLAWRPRWFAVKYNRQFREPYPYPILSLIEDIKTGDQYESSFEAARANGVLEEELVLSIVNHGYVWPTYQEFRLV